MRNTLAALALTLFAASPALAAKHHSKIAGKTTIAADAKPAEKPAEAKPVEGAPVEGTKTETTKTTKTKKSVKVSKKKVEKPSEAPAPVTPAQ